MKTTEEIYEGLLTAFAQRAGFTPEADCDLSVRLYAAAAELQSLNIQAEYLQNCQERASSSCHSFTWDHTGFEAAISLDAANLVFFSVPYDAGWSATVNGQPAEIVMVPIYEQGCEGPLLQPVQPVVFLRCVGPHPSKIARHYYVVIPIHSFLLWEVPAAKPPEVSVAVTCYEYHVSKPPSWFALSPSYLGRLPRFCP